MTYKISYKLAKELKDAGFKSNGQAWCDALKEVLPVPELSELIEDCGDNFISLKRISKKEFIASGNKETKKTTRVHFGDSRYPSYRNTTGVYLSPSMIHGDSERRRLYKARSKGKLRPDSYSASYFSFYFCWFSFYFC